MTIKQNKSQTILYAIITFVAAVGLFCFVIFDMRKLPHDYSSVLDNTVVYWLFKALCLIGGFFSAAGGVYLFKQMFSKEPLISTYYCNVGFKITQRICNSKEDQRKWNF